MEENEIKNKIVEILDFYEKFNPSTYKWAIPSSAYFSIAEKIYEEIIIQKSIKNRF